MTEKSDDRSFQEPSTGSIKLPRNTLWIVILAIAGGGGANAGISAVFSGDKQVAVDVAEIKRDVKALSEKVGNYDTRVALLEQTVASLTKDVAELKATREARRGR